MITERQIRKKTDEISIRMLREGKIPSAVSIALELSPFVAKRDGGPTMKPRYQTYRQVWDFKATNKVLKETLFDLEIVSEEVVSQLETLLARTSLVDLSYLSQRQQLDALVGLLRNMAFVSKNTEDNFYGVFDTFDDLSKVNQDTTSRGAVDLNEGVILLPQNDSTADRVDLSHLYGRQSWPISVEAPSELREGDMRVPGRVVQNEIVPGASFGFAFSDMVNAWRQIVTTGNGLGCTIEFTIPVANNSDQTASITRISMIPASTVDCQVQVLHSLDDVNWLKFPGLADLTSMPTGRTTNLDFEQTRVRFLRFRITLAAPTDRGDQASYSYVFGFKNIALHKLGRAKQAEFFSKPLTATAMEKAIDKAVLSVIESIPAGCGIDYFIAADDGTGSPRDGVWRPIQPISRAPLDGIPQIVKFGESAQKTTYLPAPNPAVIHDTVRGVDFYRVTESVLEDVPLFSQASLFRGENAWSRNSQKEKITRQARDVYVDFNSGDVQRLYVAATEVADVSSELQSALSTSLRTVLTVANLIDYDSATMPLTPAANVNPEIDQRPRYAVYKVLRFRDKMTVSDEQVTLTGTTWASLANSGVAKTGAGRPVVKNTALSVTYTEGVDYTLEEDSAGRLTGRFRRLSTSTVSSNISDGQTVKVTYQLDPDVTFLVTGVSGHKIFLSKDLGTVADQSFRVTYRHVPIPTDNEVKKSTVHVTAQYGMTEGDVYQEGRDYLIDTQNGTITRIPAGNIRGDLAVFVDFRYDQAPKELDTFSSWFFVDRRDPFTIDINPLSLDLEAGETLLIDSSDVSRRTTLPELVYGWHSVMVRSKRPEAYANAAIKKVAELLDRTGEAVFVSGGAFFSRMTANRIPLTQKTYTQLTKNTLASDHGFFAVDQGHVVVNFLPGSTDEVYSYGLRFVSGEITTGTWPEEFRLEYTYALSTADPVRSILTKVVLTRGESTDGGSTPKVFEYHLRLA